MRGHHDPQRHRGRRRVPSGPAEHRPGAPGTRSVEPCGQTGQRL